MQKITIIGNIGADAEVKNLQSGKQILSFSVGVSEKRNGQSETTWYNCTGFSENHVKLAQYIKKGNKIYIEGKPAARAYLANDGSARLSNDILINMVEFLSSANQNGPVNEPAQNNYQKAATQNPLPGHAVNYDSGGDDLPF